MYANAIPFGRCYARRGASGSAFDFQELFNLMAAGRGPRHHGRGRHGRGGFGPSWGGPRARRGDVRAALLALLEEEPRNGYGLMQEIERRSEGMWRPSPGSVYPALAQLEDEGLVRTEEASGRKLYHLTDAGREYVDAHRDGMTAPWAAVAGDMSEGVFELRRLAAQVTAALMQVAFAGSEAQVTEAKQVLSDARRTLYRILADGEPSGPEEPEAS